MKQKFSRLLLYITTCTTFALVAQSQVTPTVVFRSQSRDKMRQMVGVVGGTERTNHTHRSGMESWNGLGSIMVEYTQSFRPNRIAHCLFGDDLVTGTTPCSPCATTCSTSCNNPCSNPCSSSPSCSTSSCGESILIQGSRVSNRNSVAWLADYFYLPSDFDGSISFKPRVRNVIIDFDFYLGLDQWVSGLYFRAYGPVVNTRWDLNFCECISNAGTNSHPYGYFAPSCMSNSALLKSFEAYAGGSTITSCDGITFQPLKFAKITKCERTKTGFADLRLEFGWDFLLDNDYHLGANIQGAAPTGNKRHAEFAFAPVVGNGHHWELGGGITGHYTFWRSQDEEKAWGFHFDANFTHLFPAKEERTFDLKGKPNSRYMLAEKFTRNTTSFLAGQDIAGTGGNIVTAAFQFANEYAPVANLSTLDVKTSIAIQADIVALFNLTVRGFSWDLGYNFWARTCEKMHCLPCSPCDTSLCDQSQANMWGLKGDARAFGFAASTGGGLVIDTAVALSATESQADIHSGTNAFVTDPAAGNGTYKKNFGVDNAKFAVAGSPAVRLVFSPFLPAPDVNSNQIKTSIQPVLLSCDDIDFCERSRGISHKIFTNLGYTWDRENWRPFFGFGAYGEFGKTHGGSSSSSCNPCPTSCDSSCSSSTPSCLDCALSQWAVWVKGGIAFD